MTRPGCWCSRIPRGGDRFDTADSTRRWNALANMGVAIPVDDRLTLGLALHSRAGLGTRYSIRHLMIPFMDREVGSDLKCVGLHFNAAYQLTDKLSVGAGVRAETATARFSSVLGPADLEFGRGYAYGGGFQVGLHYQAREDLAFGLAYRSPSWFGDVAGGQGQASLLGVLPVPLGDVSINDLRLPQKVTAGVAWDATKWLKLTGEVRWLNWSGSSFHSTTLANDGLIDLNIPSRWAIRISG